MIQREIENDINKDHVQKWTEIMGNLKNTIDT
jgi:hypothetical protein